MSGAVCGRIACAVFALMFSAVSPSQPRAASWVEKNFWMSGPRYNRDLPTCDYPAALDRIIANFRTKEFRFWNSELRIVGVENIREIDTMPWAAQSIPRRYCSGTGAATPATACAGNCASSVVSLSRSRGFTRCVSKPASRERRRSDS